MKLKPLILPLLLLLSTTQSIAEVYRYTDEQGKTHYVTDKAQVPEKFQQQLQEAPELPRIGKSSSPNYSTQRTISKRPPQRPVVLVMRGCGYCNMLEKLLKEKEVRYTRYDIHTSRKGSRMYDQLGRGGVPIIKIGSNVIRGYQPGPILSALGMM